MKLNIPHIKKALACRGWSQKTLSEMSGLSRQSICTILRRGTCSFPNASKIAQALSMDIEEIYGGE